MENGSKFVHTTVRIGSRTLTSLTRRDPEIDTTWHIEHLLKNADDIRAYLELPDEMFDASVDVSGLLGEDKQLGERGIIMVDTSDPLCAAAPLFSMEDFTVLAYTERELFHRLVQKQAGPIYERTATVARAFPGHLCASMARNTPARRFCPMNSFSSM